MDTLLTLLKVLGPPVALVWVAAAVYLWTGQEQQIFPGAWGLPDEPAARARAARRAGAEEVRLPTPDGAEILAWWADAGTGRAVLYVGGNFEPVEGSAELVAPLRTQGWGLLALSPRGWPGSPGEPSERAFEADVRGAWRWLRQEQGIPAHDIVLHGRSLGGGAIGTVLDDLAPGGVVLESTFDSIRAVAGASLPLWPVSLLLRHPFDTASRVGAVEAPVLVVHAPEDSVIPVRHGRALAEAAGVDLVLTPGLDHGHRLVLADPGAREAWERLLARAAR